MHCPCKHCSMQHDEADSANGRPGDQLECAEHAEVLELSSGTGLLWGVNADRISAGWQVTLSESKDALAAAGHPFRYERIDATRIPYSDASFDIVIANHMLYHIEDRQQTLREIALVLKPGGMLCASTIGAGNRKEVKLLLRDFNSRANYEAALGTLPERFSLDNGESQIQPYFERVETRHYHNTGFRARRRRR